MKSVFAVILTLAFAVAASAEVRVNVNIGVPAPVVIAPAPHIVVSASPRVVFESPPLFVAPSKLGFYVGVDIPYDLVFDSGFYYLYYSNSWHRSRGYNGPWVVIEHNKLPNTLRGRRIEQIRSYRDKEYRVYRAKHDRYQGRYFRPDKDMREELKQERKRDKEDWKEERRHDKEERKEEQRQMKHQKHGRD